MELRESVWRQRIYNKLRVAMDRIRYTQRINHISETDEALVAIETILDWVILHYRPYRDNSEKRLEIVRLIKLGLPRGQIALQANTSEYQVYKVIREEKLQRIKRRT